TVAPQRPIVRCRGGRCNASAPAIAPPVLPPLLTAMLVAQRLAPGLDSPLLVTMHVHAPLHRRTNARIRTRIRLVHIHPARRRGIAAVTVVGRRAVMAVVTAAADLMADQPANGHTAQGAEG